MAKKKKRKTGHDKVADKGFEGFVDWMDPIVIELAEVMEAEMFGLVTGFAVRMCK